MVSLPHDTPSSHPQSFTNDQSGSLVDVRSALSTMPGGRTTTTPPAVSPTSQGNVERISSLPSTSSHESTPTEEVTQQEQGPRLQHSASMRFQSQGILRSASLTSDSSLCSTPGGTNVSFAPLPSVEGRKRKQGRLGVAARSRMLQERKTKRREIQLHEDDGPPRNIWRDTEPEDDEPDPFLALGQLVKGASKGLWRMVSRKDLKASKDQDDEDASPTAVEEEGQVVSNREHADSKRNDNSDIPPTSPLSQETQKSTFLAPPVC